jgi:hypothetical protein
MEFDKFIEWGFLGLIGAGVGWAALFLQKISQSIGELNVHVGTILEKTAWHEKELDDHDGRIKKLESRRH